MSQAEFKSTPEIIRSDTYTKEVILPQGGEQTQNFKSESRQRSSTTASDSSKHGWRKMFFGHRRNHSVPVGDSKDSKDSKDGKDNTNNKDSKVSAEDRAIALALALAQAPTAPRSRRASYTTPPEESKFDQAIKLHNNKGYQESTKILCTLAEGNHPKSQIMYGLALQNGWGIEQNMEEGFRYLQIAAYNSASIQKNASTEDEKKPAKKAMNHALYEMGNSYLHGRGVKESRSEALKYYKTGADNGDGDCQLAYGMALYGENGNHVSKADKMEAAKYFRMGEEQGYTIPSNTWFHKDKWMPK